MERQPASENPVVKDVFAKGECDRCDRCVFVTWRAAGRLLWRGAPHRLGRDEVCHVTLMEAGFWAVYEMSRGQEVDLPLRIRAPCQTCARTTQKSFCDMVTSAPPEARPARVSFSVSFLNLAEDVCFQ